MYWSFYQKWSWGSISDRRQSGVDTAWYSSYSQSAPPPHQSLHHHQLPQLAHLHLHCPLHLLPLDPFCSFSFLPTNVSIYKFVHMLCCSVIWFHTDLLNHLSIQDAGQKFPLHSAIVGWIHPQQELPASGEWDGQRVKDFFGMDAGEKKKKKHGKIFFLTSKQVIKIKYPIVTLTLTHC